MRINYDAHNGYPYVSIGKVLIDRGIVSARIDVDGRDPHLFRGRSGRSAEIMNENRSYVFFREISELARDIEPPGAQGVNLTALRSIAVDKNLHVYGTPFWIEAELPIDSEKTKRNFAA